MESGDVDLTRLRRRLEQQSTRSSTPSIHKVPRRLRNVNIKAYEPEMVTIGPYHRHRKDDFKEAEELKLCCMQSLIDRKPDVRLEQYWSAIAQVEKRARDCYAEDISMDAPDFIEMLVLDGCFIIELILRPVSDYLLFKDRVLLCLDEDLMLLENQIPFFVLCTLFDLVQGPDQHGLLMEGLLRLFVIIFPGCVLYEATKTRRSEEVKHILDLVHSNWYPPSESVNLTLSSESDEGSKDVATAKLSLSRLTVPSAAQLNDANVKFEKKEYYGNTDWLRFQAKRGTTLFDVEFNEDKGVMLMPTLGISRSIKKIFRNMIAFEQYLPINVPAPFTEYALLLDGLITCVEDVKVLTQYGIIQNPFGGDNEVVDFVNQLTEKVAYFKYADIFHRLKKHHKKPWNRAVAVLRLRLF